MLQQFSKQKKNIESIYKWPTQQRPTVRPSERPNGEMPEQRALVFRKWFLSRRINCQPKIYTKRIRCQLKILAFKHVRFTVINQNITNFCWSFTWNFIWLLNSDRVLVSLRAVSSLDLVYWIFIESFFTSHNINQFEDFITARS